MNPTQILAEPIQSSIQAHGVFATSLQSTPRLHLADDPDDIDEADDNEDDEFDEEDTEEEDEGEETDAEE